MEFDSTLLPPSPISVLTPVQVRVACKSSRCATLAVSVEGRGVKRQLYRGSGDVRAGWNYCELTIPSGMTHGEYIVRCSAYDAAGLLLHEQRQPLHIVDSGSRSTGLIDGAWCGLYHWSETEGRLWNDIIKQFTACDWRQLIQDMHAVGMNVIVLQELFRNEEYYGKHNMLECGYHGKAFYPSALYPGRMDIACSDPVEVIMSTADELGMHVLPGIGMYAWFDYTAPSLEWHKRIATEVWQRYGQHRSFYGWYISEEVFGDLRYGDDTERDIVEFFLQFKSFKQQFSPVKPVMLAPNCFYVRRTEATWRRLARGLDIICPFGFHRMDEQDDTAEVTIAMLQNIVDESGAHLWLDIESFLFNEDMSLYPRPVSDMISELGRFNSFEKILCYQFPGLMNSPTACLQPGGAATVDNFIKYKNYLSCKLENK